MTKTDKRLMKKMLKKMQKCIEEENWRGLVILSGNMHHKANYLRLDDVQ